MAVVAALVMAAAALLRLAVDDDVGAAGSSLTRLEGGSCLDRDQ